MSESSIETVGQLEEKLAEPTRGLIDDFSNLSGDVIILGAGGKIGPSLARMAQVTFNQIGSTNKVVAVSRFSAPEKKNKLEECGVETVSADLMEDVQLRKLPDAENVIYMVGRKFGTSGGEERTWAINSYLPGRIAQKFKASKVVVFSTGNVYPLIPLKKVGATEGCSANPVGEYGQSCLGRERVFEHFSKAFEIPMVFLRLNYAVELRYGILIDIARAVKEGRPVDLTMGYVNVVWQRYVNEVALRSLLLCKSPPQVLNVTGPETVPVRRLARQFGSLFNVEPQIEGEEEEDALLSDATLAHRLFGYPRVPLGQIIEWTAQWVKEGRPTYDKPTHFQEREGDF